MASNSDVRREKDRLRKRAKYQTRRDTILKNRYGIMEFDYDQIFKKQGGVCAICKSPPGAKRLDVDHCHTTKRLRGLLCNNCNRGLGHFKDNRAYLEKAITYLINFEGSKKIPEIWNPPESHWGSDWVDDGV